MMARCHLAVATSQSAGSMMMMTTSVSSKPAVPCDTFLKWCIIPERTGIYKEILGAIYVEYLDNVAISSGSIHSWMTLKTATLRFTCLLPSPVPWNATTRQEVVADTSKHQAKCGRIRGG
jgi:hypothetical protein